MQGIFQNKYRIPSARLQNWDYGCNAPYFITICTSNREHFFGEIENEKMLLNELGFQAEKYWIEIPAHFPFVELRNFVIMPNHVHGILVFNKTAESDTGAPTVKMPNLGGSGLPTETTITTNSTEKKPGGKNDKWKPAILGVIINQYKRIVTLKARQINPDFSWQTRSHDHIIRNEISFNRISDYILHNPANWKDDRFFS